MLVILTEETSGSSSRDVDVSRVRIPLDTLHYKQQPHYRDDRQKHLLRAVHVCHPPGQWSSQCWCLLPGPRLSEKQPITATGTDPPPYLLSYIHIQTD